MIRLALILALAISLDLASSAALPKDRVIPVNIFNKNQNPNDLDWVPDDKDFVTSDDSKTSHRTELPSRIDISTTGASRNTDKIDTTQHHDATSMSSNRVDDHPSTGHDATTMKSIDVSTGSHIDVSTTGKPPSSHIDVLTGSHIDVPTTVHPDVSTVYRIDVSTTGHPDVSTIRIDESTTGVMSSKVPGDLSVRLGDDTEPKQTSLEPKQTSEEPKHTSEEPKPTDQAPQSDQPQPQGFFQSLWEKIKTAVGSAYEALKNMFSSKK